MPGSPVTIGCAVLISPGASGAPDSGLIVSIPQFFASAAGMPLAVIGSMCQMINSVSGVPYMVPIGTAGASTGVTLSQQGLVRMGDRIPSGSGIMTILGPPAAPFITDGGAP
ncbi:MAG TPA: hypothetical protein VKB80_35530 [Kofleriaceae bacterium]|nr:hypothetical protein [Kofleriaceae bacterium]